MNNTTSDQPVPDIFLAKRKNIVVPAQLDRIASRIARWPWWVIIIAVGLVAIFYSILTDNVYRSALVFLTDDPRIITDRFTNVAYNVRGADGQITAVRGVITDETRDTVEILTQSEVQAVVPRRDIATITCGDGPCAVGSSVVVVRATLSGKLISETPGRFEVATDYGVTVEVFKISTTEAKRDPEGCLASRNGACTVILVLRPEKQPELKPEEQAGLLEGTLIEDGPNQIVLQIRPPLVSIANKSDIAGNIAPPTPAQCALNNVAGCNDGIFLTLAIALVAFGVANVLGLVFGLMRISRNPIFYNLSTLYVEVIRGVPLLVILLFVNFALAPAFSEGFPRLAPSINSAILLFVAAMVFYQFVIRVLILRQPLASVLFALVRLLPLAIFALLAVSFFRYNSRISTEGRAVTGLALCYGAYLAELFRAGIQSIGRGQMEASRSLGMNYGQAMRYVILPQAFRVVLPPLGNELIAILKDTSLIAILALPELTQKARLFAADTFLAFEPYITAAVLYLCMTLFLSFVVRVVERRVALPR
jgi:polar amino acid transport system permease protein